MSETQTRSRLAAILAADAVGYSRLMSADDRATVAALDAARAFFRKHIEASPGRVVDMAGDSVLAVFETAAGAVSAALATQRDVEASTNEVPSEQRLLFRIGVHLGDVIEKTDGTIYGDGVNIAARLQALAPAGGVVISDAVRGSVKNRVAARFVDLGRQSVKNIAEPVRAFQVQPTDGKGAPAIAAPRRMSWISGAIAVVIALIVGGGWYTLHGGLSLPTNGSTDAKSIAVLPFENISDDKDTSYFADGVHEDLLTQLALLGDLKVISRVSVMDYRNTKKNVKQIGAELGVGSVVEGSVRRAGNQVRVTAQLIDAKADKHLWAKTYDRDMKDIFAIQSELATDIAKSLKVSLDPQDEKRLAKRPNDNLAAYDQYLRYQEMVNEAAGSIRLSAKALDRVALLTKAVELDPRFALAWAKLGMEHARVYRWGFDASQERLVKAREAIERATALSPDDPHIKIDVAEYYRAGLSDYPKAGKLFEDVLATAPNNVEALLGLARVRTAQLQWGERVALLERALALDPRNASTLSSLSFQYREFRQFDRALALARQLCDLRPADADLKANVYLIEYWKTGSWDSYDEWRRGLPKDAATALAGVQFLDMNRALARRDFNEAERLLDIRPAELSTPRSSGEIALNEMSRALLLQAKGDRPLAIKTAQRAQKLLDSELKAQPDPNQDELLTAISTLHAFFGRREEAFAALGKAIALARDRGNMLYAVETQRHSLQLHALLGNRKEALEELARQVKRPAVMVHELRTDVALASLWDDPQFLALINDPASNKPISFDVKYGLVVEK